jgi:hypothetical protein
MSRELLSDFLINNFDSEHFCGKGHIFMTSIDLDENDMVEKINFSGTVGRYSVNGYVLLNDIDITWELEEAIKQVNYYNNGSLISNASLLLADQVNDLVSSGDYYKPKNRNKLKL